MLLESCMMVVAAKHWADNDVVERWYSCLWKVLVLSASLTYANGITLLIGIPDNFYFQVYL